MNIVFFICHDLGRELGCYGARISTPNLDRFAREGVVFENAFCNSPCCSPSRGCIMTGQYAHTNGLMGLVNRGWSLPGDARTIVDELNGAGYETAHFGIQHERAAAADNRYKIERGHARFVEDALDGAIAYLEDRAGKPGNFYLNIGTQEAHCSLWDTVNGAQRRHVYRPMPERDVYVPPYLPDAPVIRRELAGFCGAVNYMDSQMRRLFDAVDRLGFRDNTLVVFTTDHGVSGERVKGWIYDPGVAVALLMRLPGAIGAGARHRHLIQNMDLAPTLLDAAGVAPPPRMQGRSFWPLLTGGRYEPHDAIFIERNDHGEIKPMRAARGQRFHYIRNFGENLTAPWPPDKVPHFNDSFKKWYNELWPPSPLAQPEEELYDTVADPMELNNLAAARGYGPVRAGLAERLDRWMRETDDPVLTGRISRPG